MVDKVMSGYLMVDPIMLRNQCLSAVVIGYLGICYRMLKPVILSGISKVFRLHGYLIPAVLIRIGMVS